MKESLRIWGDSLLKGVVFDELRTPFLERKHYENLLCVDGIHPNTAGHALMLETMKAALS